MSERRAASGKRTAEPLLALIFTLPLLAQQPQQLQQDPKHDISMVDTVPADGAIATPLPQREEKRIRRYEIPELVGARQALGSQLIHGRLPRPLLDYIATSGPIKQRISLFEGGLVVVDLSGAVAPIRKKLILPQDALTTYLKAASPELLKSLKNETLGDPTPERSARLRVYSGAAVEERAFNPGAALPKRLTDAVLPLQDLMRAICEDRAVTSSVANYQPKEGDELVSDDRNIYRVVRVIKDQDIVELRCLTQPTTMFVKSTQLYNYFVGKPAAPH